MADAGLAVCRDLCRLWDAGLLDYQRLIHIELCLLPAARAATERGGTPMRKVTIYRDDSTVQVVYENVKHLFWTAGNSVLVVAQYTDAAAGTHRYVHWPRERFCWFKDEKAEEVKS